MTTPDGVDEAVEAVLRVALTAAGMLAERLARRREAERRAATAASEQEARELAARLSAERAAAAAALTATEREEWWRGADAGRVAETWGTAVQWRDADPAMADRAERYRQQVRDRYGVDPADAGADPEAVARELETRAAEADAAAARAERVRLGRELPAAAAVLDTDDRRRDEPSNEQRRDQAAAGYDTAKRRRALAERVEEVAGGEAAEARAQADVHQARPATHAVVQSGPHPSVKRASRRVRAWGADRGVGR